MQIFELALWLFYYGFSYRAKPEFNYIKYIYTYMELPIVVRVEFVDIWDYTHILGSFIIYTIAYKMGVIGTVGYYESY